MPPRKIMVWTPVKKYQAALAADPDFVLAKLYINEPDPVKWRQHRQEAFAAKDQGLGHGTVPSSRLRSMPIRAIRTEGSRPRGSWFRIIPISPRLIFELGWAFNLRRELGNAAASFRRSIEIDPDFYNGWFSLASQHVAVGNNVELPEEEKDIDAA